VILERKDKKGFPVPLGKWMHGELREFLLDTFASEKARSRPYLDPRFDAASLIETEPLFGRSLWGLLSLELWQQEFHDRGSAWRTIEDRTPETPPLVAGEPR
jgi:asparagine synthase (glutamine-hydrolysing)